MYDKDSFNGGNRRVSGKLFGVICCVFVVILSCGVFGKVEVTSITIKTTKQAIGDVGSLTLTYNENGWQRSGLTGANSYTTSVWNGVNNLNKANGIKYLSELDLKTNNIKTQTYTYSNEQSVTQTNSADKTITYDNTDFLSTYNLDGSTKQVEEEPSTTDPEVSDNENVNSGVALGDSAEDHTTDNKITELEKKYDTGGILISTADNSNGNSETSVDKLDTTKVNEWYTKYTDCLSNSKCTISKDNIKDENAKFAYGVLTGDDKLSLTYQDDPLNNDIPSASKEIYAKLGLEISTTGYTNTMQQYTALEKAVTDAETKLTKERTKEDNTDNVKKAEEALKTAQAKLAQGETIIQNIPSDELYSVYSTLNTEQMEELNDQLISKECGDSWTGIICRAMNQDAVLDKISIGTYDEIKEILKKHTNKDGKIDDDAYNAELKTILADKTKNSKITDPSTNTIHDISYDAIKYTNIEEYINMLKNNKASCQKMNDNDCINKINSALAIAEPLYNRELVETGLGYDLMNMLMNPDQKALDAAALFGFEADYSDLPKWLGEDVSSTICLASIDGYLDDTSDSGTGITEYKDCDSYDAEGNPSDHCREVKADIRAQRTPTAPNNKTSISYSYYLKAPESKKLLYVVAISYIENGARKTIALETNKSVDAEETVKEYQNIDYSLDNPELVENDSFRIAIAAFYENEKEYTILKIPIVLASADAYTEVTKNGGNSQANQVGQDNEDDGFTTSDMVAMIDFD